MNAVVSQPPGLTAVWWVFLIVALIVTAGAVGRLRRLSKRPHTPITGRALGEARIAVYDWYPSSVTDEINEMERQFNGEDQ